MTDNLTIQVNGQHFIEFSADGKIIPGPGFDDTDKASGIVFRALTMRYPTWLGNVIAMFVRNQGASLGPDGAAVIRGALGGARLQVDQATKLWGAICEQLACRAEEAGTYAAQQEQKRQDETKVAEAPPAVVEPPAQTIQ